MSKKQDLDELLFFSGEKEAKRNLFERTPVRSLALFLECFDENDKQVRSVPKFVLEFMATRIRTFIISRSGSLDDAFGGKTRSQLNAISLDERDNEVVFDLYDAWERAKEIPKVQRVRSTPYDIAVQETAEKHTMSEDNVHRIYKKLGK